jgi:exosome complex exonuclease RRP6
VLRPLSDDMLKYARSDTHFLLYCFDMLRNELLDKSNPSDSETSKMHQVIQGSQDASLRLYEREIYDADNGDRPMGWRNILGRSQESLNPMQTSVFKAVHRWRDITARIEDESVHYILPRPHLFNIARKMPSEVAGVLACCPRHCPQIKIRASELVYIIREAMDAPEVRAWKDSMARGIEIPHQKQQPVAARATPVVTKEGPRVDVFALEGTLEIKAEKSSFWGTCDDSSRWQSIIKGKNDPMDELRLAVPLPQLTAEVFVTRDYSLPASSHKPMDPGSRAEHEYVKHRPKKDSENDVIIVRSIGGGYKRKLDEAVDPSEDSKTNPVAREAPAEQNDEGGLKSESPPLDPASLAADGTKCKGRRKKKKKSEGEKETGEGQDDEMTTGVSLPAARPGQPFDYASAPSVLHARPQNDKKDSNKGKKTFDPYSQSGNALRGLSRGNQERAGRSLTFQS